MPESPRRSQSDVITFTILLDGSEIKEEYQVTQIQVTREVNKIPHARVVLLDGRKDRESFEISESEDFVPGKEIEIKAGYFGHDEATLFKGIIVKHGLRARSQHASQLVVTCYDKAVKMTLGRKNAYYLKQKDSDVIDKVIGAAGLAKDVAATSTEHEEIVQYYATDWDFILTRAEINGLIVLVEAGKVTVQAPEVSGTPELVVTFGDEIQDLDAEIDARSQLAAVQGIAWDMASQKVISGDSKEPTVNEQGNLTGKKLSEVVGLASFGLQTTVALPEAMLKSWANAQLLKSRLARIRGKVSFLGNAQPQPGKLIELAGTSKRFDGNAFVTGVRHLLEGGVWTTEVAFGLAPRWFTEEQPDIEAPLAAGLLPGIHGLHIGKVKKIDNDPEGQTRVQVDLPIIAPSGDGVWARLAKFYATNNAGSFFMPEVGDEVVLGFLNDDPRHPVILGSLYSKARQPPYTPDDKNTYKAIVTNSKMKIWFDEVKKIIQIETPGGHVMTMSDDKKTITLTDSNKNKIEMASGGITVESPKDIKIKATGKISLEATGGMDLKTSGNLSLQGLNVDIKADVALTAQGQASATFKASGNTTIQGAMVMIN